MNPRQPRSLRRLRPVLISAVAMALAFGVVAPANAGTVGGGTIGSAAEPPIDDLATAISSDGKTTVVPDSARPEDGEEGFEGDGKPGDDGATQNTNPLSLGSAPKPGGVMVQTVIGNDDRVRVNPTTSYPARATVWITRTVDGVTRKWCTGWMYSSHTVATAGHCVHNGPGKGWVPADQLRVWPGRNGASAPFGSCSVKATHTVLGYSDHDNPDYDYGAISLNCTVGNSTGWYGWWWQSASLTGTADTVTGYPFDKDDGTQWTHSGHVYGTTDRQVRHQQDTFNGNSGSPIYQYRPAGSKYCVGNCAMAIHAYGSDQYRPYNAGTRIVKKVAENLRFWRDTY